MAGRDRDRLADLDPAYRDPDVRAIVTTRGGAGAYRIVDPALWVRARMPGIHGGIAGPRAASTIRRLLMTGERAVLRRDDRGDTAALSTGGRASGVLLLETERPPGLEVGHGRDPDATLLGTKAHLDAEEGTLTVEPAATF